MSELSALLSRLDLGSLDRVSKEKMAQITTSCQGVSPVYVELMRNFGWGAIGPINIFEYPVAPCVIYPEEVAKCLEGFLIFADDGQGYCFAFETRRDYRVVEIGPRGDVDRSTPADFLQFLKEQVEGY